MFQIKYVTSLEINEIMKQHLDNNSIRSFYWYQSKTIVILKINPLLKVIQSNNLKPSNG